MHLRTYIYIDHYKTAYKLHILRITIHTKLYIHAREIKEMLFILVIKLEAVLLQTQHAI